MDASNPFGKQYKAISRACRPHSGLFQQSTPASTEFNFAQNILETLYPHRPQAPFIDSTASSPPNDSPFSSRELTRQVRDICVNFFPLITADPRLSREIKVPYKCQTRDFPSTCFSLPPM
ncbi:hypothetical protein AVEN_166108-1 [Araneus ventricosus]|uniref:Uncharacterized protein n=1 Tax=Araneus ventricosus TaxID=182803 RepID=A0A4Y2FSM8_ARAVE|nr:hypothetical protein AVEN_166108-1 [Araneus ventricosus]